MLYQPTFTPDKLYKAEGGTIVKVLKDGPIQPKQDIYYTDEYNTIHKVYEQDNNEWFVGEVIRVPSDSTLTIGETHQFAKSFYTEILTN